MKRNLMIGILLAAAAVGCGGGGASVKPLKHHFDETNIALVPIDDKQAMLKAQQAYHEAKAYVQQAEAQLKEANTEIKIAKNKKKQAGLEYKSAKERKKSADATNDMNKVNAAAKEMRVAQLDKRAADYAVEYRAAAKKYHKKYLRYTQEEMYAKEAKYELAKARIAREKNIIPKGFKLENYEYQAEKRSETAQRSKAASQELKGKIEGKKQKLAALEQEAASARGSSTALSDDNDDD